MSESHYDLTFSQIDRLKAEMKSIEKRTESRVRREAERETQEKVAMAQKETAKRLFRLGLSVAEIASSTGLTKKEVEKLKK